MVSWLNLYTDPRTFCKLTEMNEINHDMNLIQSWLAANKLTLNVKKTKYMLIGSHIKLSQIHNDVTIKINNIPLILKACN